MKADAEKTPEGVRDSKLVAHLKAACIGDFVAKAVLDFYGLIFICGGCFIFTVQSESNPFKIMDIYKAMGAFSIFFGFVFLFLMHCHDNYQKCRSRVKPEDEKVVKEQMFGDAAVALPSRDAVFFIDIMEEGGRSPGAKDADDKGSSVQKTKEEKKREGRCNSTGSQPPAYEEVYP
ncbi:unnamed protein product [Ophioblennius macclurei]